MNMHKENHLKGDFLWEFACAPESWLSQAILDRHLIARRINLSEGYDLFKPDTWRRLRVLRDVHKPKKLWFSLPCARFCNWVSVNYNTPERKERLEDLRRKDRRMMRQAKDFILETVHLYPDTDVYWKWTHPCTGWSQQPMVQLQDGLHSRGLPWLPCRIDGCNYGMVNKDGALAQEVAHPNYG